PMKETAMVRALVGLVLIALWVGGPDRAAADRVKNGRTVHRIAVQGNEANPQLWNLTLNNIANLIGAMGKEHVDIKVIAYGPASTCSGKTGATSSTAWTALR